MHSRILRICCFLLLIVCGVLQLKLSVLQQLAVSKKTDNSQVEKFRNTGTLTHQAKELYLFEADMEGALHLLQVALQVNPLYVPAWLSLVELYNDMGEKDKAYSALEYTDTLTSDLKKYRWDKALVAYQVGRKEMLPTELSYIIHDIPGKNRNDALQLAFTMWESPEDLLKNIGEENATHLFNWAVWKKEPDKALFFWKLLEKDKQRWAENELLALLDLLINTDRVLDAEPIWREHFNEDTIIYNGDFSKPFLNRAFGWRIGKNKGFDQKVESGNDKLQGNSLYYRFKGWENINFHHLTQVIPIQGGRRYILDAEMKAEKISTNQRPFLEVYGYKCEAKHITSEMVDPYQDWNQYAIEFGVPEDCSAMVVRLRRYESHHIDNKLSGKLWIRNITIKDTGEDFSVLDVMEEE